MKQNILLQNLEYIESQIIMSTYTDIHFVIFFFKENRWVLSLSTLRHSDVAIRPCLYRKHNACTTTCFLSRRGRLTIYRCCVTFNIAVPKLHHHLICFFIYHIIPCSIFSFDFLCGWNIFPVFLITAFNNSSKKIFNFRSYFERPLLT
jgi:hypothetical protein